jgi:tetratricopeptide (TPR) repeat protein
LQNNFDEGYYFKGKCYEKLGMIPQAIEAYQTALMYDPNYIEARDALGKLGVKS